MYWKDWNTFVYFNLCILEIHIHKYIYIYFLFQRSPWGGGGNIYIYTSPGEGNGNPLQYACLGNPTGRGAWQTTIHAVAKSWIRLTPSRLYHILFHCGSSQDTECSSLGSTVEPCCLTIVYSGGGCGLVAKSCLTLATL